MNYTKKTKQKKKKSLQELTISSTFILDAIKVGNSVESIAQILGVSREEVLEMKNKS